MNLLKINKFIVIGIIYSLSSGNHSNQDLTNKPILLAQEPEPEPTPEPPEKPSPEPTPEPPEKPDPKIQNILNSKHFNFLSIS